MVRGLNQFNKLSLVCHASVLLLVMNFVICDIVKVAVDPQGHSGVDPQTKYFDNAVMKFIVNNRTEV